MTPQLVDRAIPILALWLAATCATLQQNEHVYFWSQSHHSHNCEHRWNSSSSGGDGGTETGTAVTSRATNKTTRVSDFSILYYVRPGRCHIATSERMSHDSACEYDNNWQTVVNNRLVNKRWAELHTATIHNAAEPQWRTQTERRLRGAAASSNMWHTFFTSPPPVRAGCISVSVYVCISTELHVRSSPNYLHVTYGHGSVILWRRCDTLRTSGFTDEVIFAHNGLK